MKEMLLRLEKEKEKLKGSREACRILEASIQITKKLLTEAVKD